MAQLRDILKKSLQQIATQENIKEYELEIKQLSTEGANYTSEIFSAKILSRNRPDLELFAKVSCLSEAVREQMRAHLIFETERYVYHDLANIYNDIQEKYKVPVEERFKFPKFFCSNANSMEETIVLENLTAQGYIMYDRFKAVNWEYASKAVEELAKFHALSFAFQNERPDEFPIIDSKFNMALNMSVDVIKTAFSVLAKGAYSVLSKTVRIRLEEFVEEIWEKERFKKYYGPAKHSVLAHGDYRASNILFKRQAGKVKSLVPVDYQTVRLASPTTDLLYFIYTGTDEEFRRLHLKHLLDHYYATLSKFLILFNMDPEAVYSRNDFDKDFIDFLSYGLATAVFVLPIVMVDPSNAPNMNDESSDINSFSVTPTDAYKKRFIPIVNEFIDLDFL